MAFRLQQLRFGDCYPGNTEGGIRWPGTGEAQSSAVSTFRMYFVTTDFSPSVESINGGFVLLFSHGPLLPYLPTSQATRPSPCDTRSLVGIMLLPLMKHADL